MIPIVSIDDPRIAPFRSLRDISQRNAATTLFVVENSKIIRRLLKSSCEVRTFFATAAYYEEFTPLLDAKGVSPHERLFAEESLMNEIVGFAMHEGVMALAEAPPVPHLFDSLRTLAFPAVCLCGVIDAENVGAIVRNCAAFGVRSLIVDAATCSPYLRRAVRVSLGGIFGLQVYRTANLPEALEELRHTRPQVRSIALETSVDALPLHTFPRQQETMFIFGSEAKGIPSEVLRAVDAVATIPMPTLAAFDAVNSLNVAASTAIALYHLSAGN
ncbi:MAG: RNA methyltransferase [Candidatus Kapabacteria bacterium]|jgi:tRNA G18 (ribose-2'-O)-methylase SpoU|nr:RNA methyltransferase [Candidatus Kapabacteria bacterium]